MVRGARLFLSQGKGQRLSFKLNLKRYKQTNQISPETRRGEQVSIQAQRALNNKTTELYYFQIISKRYKQTNQISPETRRGEQVSIQAQRALNNKTTELYYFQIISKRYKQTNQIRNPESEKTDKKHLDSRLEPVHTGYKFFQSSCKKQTADCYESRSSKD